MKRILSLFLLCSLILNIFNISVSAVEPQSGSDIQSTEFELLKALGIDAGINEDLSAPITRSEFAAMAVRAINMTQNGINDGTFSDVPAGHPFENEIYMAKNLRMTSGTSETTFSPDDTVGVNAALKILLVAMGYENTAVSLGGFPAGYLRLDADLDISQGVSNIDAITVFDAKTMVTNALKEDMAVFEAIDEGDFIYETKKGVNLLSRNFKLKSVSGIVTKAGFLSSEESFNNDLTVTISGHTYKTERDFDKFFGNYVYAWVGEEDNTVYAMEYSGRSKTTVLDAENIISHKDCKLTYLLGDKTKTYKTAPGITFIENGRVISHSDSDYSFPDGTLTLTDTEGDGIYDYAIAEKKQYFVISGINGVNQVIYDKNSPLGYVELEDDEDKVRMIFDDSGSKLDFSDLSEGMVVEVIQSFDEKVSKLIVSDSVKKDAVVTERGDRVVITEDGEYETNSYFESSGITVNPGESYTLYIAGDGTLTYAKRLGGSDISYGYFLAFKRNNKGIEHSASMKILMSSNTVGVFKLADKITFDGESGVGYTDSRIDNTFVTDGIFNYQLIRYALNENDEIKLIDTCDATVNQSWELDKNQDVENMLTQYIDGGEVNYRGGSGFGSPSFSFKKAILFVAPQDMLTSSGENYEDEAFEVGKYTDLTNNVNYQVDIFDFDENYYPKVVIVYKDTTGASFDSNGGNHLVYSVTDALTSEGDTTKLIRSYSQGRYYRYFVDAEKLDEITLPKSGDVVLYSLNFNNNITAIKTLASYDPVSQSAVIQHDGDYNSVMSFVSGKVKTIGDGSLVIRATAPPSGATLQNTGNIIPFPLTSPSYAVYDVKTGTVTRTTEQNILTEELVGNAKADYVVCRLGYFEVRDVIIYRQ